MREKSFAGALLVVGLLIFGFRMANLFAPHAAPPQNLASTAGPKPILRTEEPAPAKAEKIPAAIIIKKRPKPVVRANPTSAKAATSSSPHILPASSPPPSPPPDPALLEIEVEHKFAEAHLSIWVDDSLTYTHTLEGTDKKHLVVFHQVKGHEFHAMQLSPGKHLLRVQVSSGADGSEQSATVTGEFVSGKEKMLHILFTKQGKMDLSLQ